MASALAATMILLWQRGQIVLRCAMGMLVAAQIVWGGDVYFIPTHIMFHHAPIQGVAELFAAGYTKDFEARLHPSYWGFWKATHGLAPNAKILLHEKRTHLGFERMTVSDAIGWQGGISYGQLGSVRAIHQWLTSIGVTHVMWEADVTKQVDSLAGELLFLEFLRDHTGPVTTIDKYALAAVKSDPTSEGASEQVLLLGCRQTYDDGIYDLAQLSVPGLGRHARREYPKPKLPLWGGGDLLAIHTTFAVVDAACNLTSLPNLETNYQLMAVRNRQQLWIRADTTAWQP